MRRLIFSGFVRCDFRACKRRDNEIGRHGLERYIKHVKQTSAWTMKISKDEPAREQT